MATSNAESEIAPSERFYASESRIIITGAVWTQPSIRYYRSGWPSSRFMLKFQNAAEWLDTRDQWAGVWVVSYGALAETTAKYLKVDAQVYIRGHGMNYTTYLGTRLQICAEFVYRFGSWTFDWKREENEDEKESQ